MGMECARSSSPIAIGSFNSWIQHHLSINSASLPDFTQTGNLTNCSKMTASQSTNCLSRIGVAYSAPSYYSFACRRAASFTLADAIALPNELKVCF